MLTVCAHVCECARVYVWRQEDTFAEWALSRLLGLLSKYLTAELSLPIILTIYIIKMLDYRAGERLSS